MEPPPSLEFFSRLLPRGRLHPAALAQIDRSAADGETWLVAFSGGADSVALLLSLLAGWPQQSGKLVVAHFNHALRGNESDGDETFCREFCATLKLAFRCARWHSPPEQPSEETARLARFEFLQTVAVGEGATLLLTGHQLDDVLETQLLRLSRGSGTAGLAAPRPVRRWRPQHWIVRPLLSVGRTELRSALQEAGFPWREDSSNQQTHFARNRLRHHVVLPWLQASGEGVLNGAALSRELLQEDDEALESLVDGLGIDFESPQIDLGKLQRQPRAILRRALHRWSFLPEVDRRCFEELLRICQRGAGQVSLGAGIAAVCDGALTWSESPRPAGAFAPWSPAWLAAEGLLLLPSGSQLRSAIIAVTPQLRVELAAGKYAANTCALVCEELPFIVRSWQPGDRYRPLGASGSTTLQDMFVNRKIAAALRRELPVVCRADGNIIWVPGLLPAEQSKVTDVSVTAVQLTYTSGTSTVRKQS
jgi:tRNA(Ile)-lysidine synthase